MAQPRPPQTGTGLSEGGGTPVTAVAEQKVYLPLTTTDGATIPQAMEGYGYVSIQVLTDNWGSAEVDFEWSLDGENWHSTTTTDRLSSSTPARKWVDATGTLWVRLATSTADGDADAQAEALIWPFVSP